MEDSYLTQHVTGATKGEHVLDLVRTSNPGMINKVNILGHFGKSDHSLLQWETEVIVASKRAFRPTLDYGKTNYPLMKKELRSMEWKMVMQGSTEECWTKFKSIINDLVSRYIPRKKPNQKGRKKALRMKNKAVQLVRKKYMTFAKHKNSLSSLHQSNKGSR